MAGAWRLFEFDVTAQTNTTGANALAVEVFAPTPHDLGITFVDWNPLPPDKDMGLWRDVHINATGPVEIRFPSVTTHLNSPANDVAQLTVRAELASAADHPVEGDLKGTIGKLAFSQHLRLDAHETRVVHAALKVQNPELWWPSQVGPQTLQTLDLRFEVSGKLSDSSSTRFGIREVTSEIDGKGHRLFHVNGRNILIRGAGYTFDMLLNGTPERQEAELKYVRDMNLNAVRFEGKLEDDHFLDLADQYGILVLAGWCCCDHWEKWPQWEAEDEAIAAASLRDQLRRLARHPAVSLAGGGQGVVGAGLAEGDVRLAANEADADFQALPGGGFPRRGQGQGRRLPGVVPCQVSQAAGRQLRVAGVGGQVGGNFSGVQPLAAGPGAADVVVQQDGAAMVVHGGHQRPAR